MGLPVGFFDRIIGAPSSDDPTRLFDRAYYTSFYDQEGAVKQLRRIAIIFTT